MVFVRIEPHEIKVQLVGVGLGEEVAAAGEVFQVEEFVFFQAMHGFHVALIGVRRGRDAHVLAVAESLGKIALELAAVVGLPDQVAERNAVAIQVLLDARSENRAGRSAALFGKGPKQQATANFPRGVLNDGQAELLGLSPVARDIVEILGVGADLLKQRPGSLDVREVLLALIFSAAFFEQAVLAPDAFQSVMTDAQVELANESPCTESGQGFAEFHELGLHGGRSLVRLPVTGARSFDQAGRAVLLEAAQPFAYGGDGRGKEPRGGFDTALSGAFHQTQPMVISVFHLTHQIKIATGSGHGAAILPAGHCPAAVEKPLRGKVKDRLFHSAWKSLRDSHFPTAATTTNPAPPCVSRSRTSTPPGGYDVTGLFQSDNRVDRARMLL